MAETDLVVVRTFRSVVEAELAKSALEAADIPSFAQADDAGGMRPHLAALEGVRLVVRSDDVKRAARILDSDAPQR